MEVVRRNLWLGRTWRLDRPLRAAWQCLRAWRERDRDRLYPAVLDDAQLKDLALTRAQLRAVLSWPLWRKPRSD
ncbi:MAG: hypothetical protein KGL11_11615 [Alphaproteobacteria bacterium]|nr:hypothetical protein [Alphaproteobacteria bacterium]